MQNVYLKLYFTEKRTHNGMLMHEWLLKEARKHGVPGGSVFRAIAGYGRDGTLREETFIELGGELPVQIEFLLEKKMADSFLEALREYKLNIPYVRYSVSLGVV